VSVGFCVPSIMQGAHGRGVLVGDGTAQPPDRPRVSACSVVVIATVLCTRDDGTQSSRMLAFCCFFDAISAHCDARRYNNCSHPVRHGKRAIYLADSQMDWKDGPITGGGLEPGPTGDSAALFYELMEHLTQPRCEKCMFSPSRFLRARFCFLSQSYHCLPI